MNKKILYSIIGLVLVGGLFSAVYAGPIINTITFAGLAIFKENAQFDKDVNIDGTLSGQTIDNLQTQIDDLPSELFSCQNGGQSCTVGVGECENSGINVCMMGTSQCSASTGASSPEICDSLDNDCDGETDEGVSTTFFEDGDGDSFGNPASFVEACTQPDGFVTDNSDCDDGQASVNPAQMEICDGLDNDCDGSIDEGGVCILTETNCSDGIDNDGDGGIDCIDSDCSGLSCGPSGQVCSAGICVQP